MGGVGFVLSFLFLWVLFLSLSLSSLPSFKLSLFFYCLFYFVLSFAQSSDATVESLMFRPRLPGFCMHVTPVYKADLIL